MDVRALGVGAEAVRMGLISCSFLRGAGWSIQVFVGCARQQTMGAAWIFPSVTSLTLFSGASCSLSTGNPGATKAF